jgi:putative flavoprotein involved in K+ transport
MDADVLVVGAGPAGLATAACLKRRGVRSVVLDRGERVGDSWRARYDRLHLHTPRTQSGLPGLPIPRRFGRWVSRDDFVRYLAGYARFHGIEPRFRTEVRRLGRDSDRWRAATPDGEVVTRQVVVATGYNNIPKLPAWPGRDGFRGELVHASAYRRPDPYVGRDVLVVGTGNTGAEIAAELADSGAARVRLAVRTPPNLIPREIGPVPTTLLGIGQDHLPARLVDPVNSVVQRLTIGDLTPHGLPRPRQGVAAQLRATDVVPIIDVGIVEQLRKGRVEPVAAVAGFDGDEVVLADGTRIAPTVVIAATGYARGLEPLVGHLGVLDGQGRPRAAAARFWPAAPALRFVGMSNPQKGLLLQINVDARLAARAIVRELTA